MGNFKRPESHDMYLVSRCHFRVAVINCAMCSRVLFQNSGGETESRKVFLIIALYYARTVSSAVMPAKDFIWCKS